MMYFILSLEMPSYFMETIPEESKIVISALAESIAWQMGSVRSTSLWNTDCKSYKKSCLKRVILEASETLVKPQKSRSGLE